MDRKLNLININKSKIKFYVNCSLIKPKWPIQQEQPQRSSQQNRPDPNMKKPEQWNKYMLVLNYMPVKEWRPT